MKINYPLLALAIGAFGIGTTEFSPMGLLPVIARGAQGKEQGLFRKTERATVGQQETNVSSTLAIALRPHHRGDFLY